MTKYKITTLAFIGLPLGLLALALLIKQPQVLQYERTVEQLVASKKFDSEAEVLDHYEALAEVKNKLDQVANLNSTIRAKVSSTLPPASAAEQQALDDKLQVVRQLRIEIARTLQQFALKVAGRVIQQGLQP